MVQPGYPKCPRCGMPLPMNQANSQKVAGGTAVEPESNSVLWLGLGALVLVGAAVAFAATRGGDDAQPAERAAAPVANDEGTSPSPSIATSNEDVGIRLDEAPPTASELRERAQASFEASLVKARLWSTVSVEDGTVLRLVSGACADENMQPTIAAAAQELAAVGFTAIRCHEKHGEQVFEQGL